ncbi:hypothetical protein PVAG01_11118 [Phlyctema vagabunda]|uniref:Orc1-like AAA ATPase domain-containing protein n=1 Tax=Phlyctema vagabunda TaxID=108571 RepID=A0ABR4P1D8_9HELO
MVPPLRVLPRQLTRFKPRLIPTYGIPCQRAFTKSRNRSQQKLEEHVISPRSNGQDKQDESFKWKEIFGKLLETSLTTFASIAILGSAGYFYHRYYKKVVLEKMENAFEAGYSSLELAALARHEAEADLFWIPRTEQEQIDAIVQGNRKGHYHLIVGEKGVGKTSLILQAMKRIHGDGIAMFDAHGDLEIFRLRLGKALDFEFNEDYIGSFFSIKGQRDTTALLDIERAFNKLEKVALKRREIVRRPLVLIINNSHLIRDDEDGQDLLELIQQRAEIWAASGLVTVVLNSDDYWVYERLKQNSTRMQVVSVGDIGPARVFESLKTYRKKIFGEDIEQSVLKEVYDKIGGRLNFLSQVAMSENMLRSCDHICKREKTWFLNKCWILGEPLDPHVEEQQTYCAAAMVLAKALVDKEKEMLARGDASLPQIPLHKAREIITRADFMQNYDHINIFAIDSDAMVRADSVPMMNAFRDVCTAEGFEDHLQATLDRLDAIESLQRTRELTLKDLQQGLEYLAVQRGLSGRVEQTTTLSAMETKEK